MGANNWQKCFQCESLHNAEIKAMKQRLNDEYGVLSLIEYNKLREQVATIEAEVLPETLREDWEIGIWDGVFHTTYTAQCTSCTFIYRYNFEKDLK